MKVPKTRIKASIICKDGSFIKGFIHVNEGLRIFDFLNDSKERFIAITGAEFANVKNVHSFQLYAQFRKKRGTILLSKDSVKWVEEIKG